MINLKKTVGVLGLAASLIITPNVLASDDNYFDQYLTDGKLVVKSFYDKEWAEDVLGSYVYLNYDGLFPKYDFNEEGSSIACNEDFTKCTFEKYVEETGKSFEKELDVVWSYDKDVKIVVDNILKKVPEDGIVFKLNDIETLKYVEAILNFVNKTSDSDEGGYSDIPSAMSFSSEFKNFIGYRNFVFEPRLGFSTLFSDFESGTADFKYDNTVYALVDNIGVRTNMVLYVDDNETNIEKALNDRLSKYFDKISVKKSDISKTEFVNNYIDTEVSTFSTCRTKYNEHIASEPVYPVQEDGESSENYMTRMSEYFEAESEWRNSWNSTTVGDTYCNSYVFDEYPTDADYREHFEYVLYEEEDQNQKVLDFLDNVIDDTYIVKFSDGTEFTFFVEKNSKKVYNSDVSFISNDSSTGISVSLENNLIPLDTLIQVAKLTGGEDYEKIIKILNNDNVEMFDLKLFSKSADKYITKLDNGSFEIKIPIPDKFKNKDLIVYYVDDKNNIEAHEVTVKDGNAVFTTDHFSIYTLAEKPSETNPNTIDNIYNSLLILLVSASGLIIIKKLKENN